MADGPCYVQVLPRALVAEGFLWCSVCEGVIARASCPLSRFPGDRRFSQNLRLQ